MGGEGGEGNAPRRSPPIELASGIESPGSLAQDEDDLYFTAADGVYRCAKSGEPTWFKKVTDGMSLGQLVVDDTWVYFVDGGRSGISKVEKAGGLAQNVVAADSPSALASDGTLLFYSAAAGVFSVNKDGSGVRQLYVSASPAPDSIYAIATAGTTLVFGDNLGRGIFAVEQAGGAAPRQLTKVTQSVWGVAVTANVVVFREGSGGAGLLATVPLAGGERQDRLTNEPGPSGVAAADGRVYFADNVPGAAEIKELNLSTDESGTLATQRAAAMALQVDAGFVYWTEPSSGKLVRQAR
jgi:hypothetical protein